MNNQKTRGSSAVRRTAPVVLAVLCSTLLTGCKETLDNLLEVDAPTQIIASSLDDPSKADSHEALRHMVGLALGELCRRYKVKPISSR